MNKQLPLRIVYNLVLVVLAVVSVVVTAMIAEKEYRGFKTPEIYTDKQIIQQVKQEYSDFEFSDNDDWNIGLEKAGDNKHFTAIIQITKNRELSKRQYIVRKSFSFMDGNWVSNPENESLELGDVQWLVGNTNWSASSEDGVDYHVTFTSETVAEISVKETKAPQKNETTQESSLSEVKPEDDVETAGEAMVGEQTARESISDSDNVNERKETVKATSSPGHFVNREMDINKEKKETCFLSENSDGTSYTGIIETPDGVTITLMYDDDAVKLKIGDEKGEFILRRE